MSKKLILICGPNGVGKSTACLELLQQLDNSAYVDSDWCSAWNPFVHNEETKILGKSTMNYMLANYLKSSMFHNVIWHYGFHGHRKTTFDEIMYNLSQLNIDFMFIPIILECELEEHINRMKTNNRDAKRIQRAIINTREIYNQYIYQHINVTHLSVQETVNEMIKIINM